MTILNPFQPTIPFITPSLNRVRIMDLPGFPLPAEVKGKSGYDLLSACRLADRIRQEAAGLQLDPDQPELLRTFDSCFMAVSPQVRQTAHAIAEEYGRFLAYLLLTLKRGDPVNRAARPQWEDRHWTWWRNISTIWLGGGLVSGRLGVVAADTAQTILREAGFPQAAIPISPFGGNLSLAGAARLLPDGSHSALVFDFGHTQVKRAIAQFENGRFANLLPLSPLPAPCEPYTYHGWLPERSHEVMAGMVTAVSQTWTAAQHQGAVLAPAIVISLACYLVDGHPVPAHLETGCYSRLQTLSGNLTRFMGEQISVALAQPIHVELVHDATGAALAHTGDLETAVITLGTSMGIGFPSVSDAHLRPIDSHHPLL